MNAGGDKTILLWGQQGPEPLEIEMTLKRRWWGTSRRCNPCVQGSGWDSLQKEATNFLQKGWINFFLSFADLGSICSPQSCLAWAQCLEVVKGGLDTCQWLAGLEGRSYPEGRTQASAFPACTSSAGGQKCHSSFQPTVLLPCSVEWRSKSLLYQLSKNLGGEDLSFFSVLQDYFGFIDIGLQPPQCLSPFP